MKIVAISSANTVPEFRKFLVEATGEELMQLFGGKYTSVSYQQADHKKALKIGAEIKVAEAFQYLHWIYNHRADFQRMADRMREQAATLDKFPELFTNGGIPELEKAR